MYYVYMNRMTIMYFSCLYLQATIICWASLFEDIKRIWRVHCTNGDVKYQITVKPVFRGHCDEGTPCEHKGHNNFITNNRWFCQSIEGQLKSIALLVSIFLVNIIASDRKSADKVDLLIQSVKACIHNYQFITLLSYGMQWLIIQQWCPLTMFRCIFMPHGGILLLLCSYVCTGMYVRMSEFG